MARSGLLIDYDFCTGCHVCEVACQMEYHYPADKSGIQVQEIGPWKITEDKWQLSYVPVPTDLCNLCAGRVAKGRLPACVAACQQSVMKFGPVQDLLAELESKPKQVLFAPK